jgi:integrase
MPTKVRILLLPPQSTNETSASAISAPIPGTTLAQENGGARRAVKFPHKVVGKRGEALIFGRSPANRRYRVCWRSAGRRRFRSFKTFTAALTEAEKIVKDLDRGSPVGALTQRDLADWQAAKAALIDLRVPGQRNVSLSEVAANYVQAVKLLPEDVTILRAVRGFLKTVVEVVRVPVKQAVDDYIAEREKKTVAKDGKRPLLDKHYVAQDRRRLNVVATAFKCDVADVTAEHLRVLFTMKLGELATKSVNHYRGSIRAWLKWCVGRNYIAENIRLHEAPILKAERVMGADIEIIGAKELRALLDAASPEMQPVIALASFGGMRSEEILRLDWSDVWRRPGFVEVTARKSKTRSRRLIPICPALQAWLEPWRQHQEGPVVAVKYNSFHLALGEAFTKAKVARPKNILRHSAISHWMAHTGDENKVAALAGTSPAMIFGNYRALCTPAEATAWFSVMPSGTAKNIVSLPQQAAQS